MSLKTRISAAWKTLPSSVRKSIVLVIGSTLIVIGLVLIILPGPFTMPLLILGLVVLALEFAWAERMLEQVKIQGAKVDPRKLLKKKSKE